MCYNDKSPKFPVLKWILFEWSQFKLSPGSSFYAMLC